MAADLDRGLPDGGAGKLAARVQVSPAHDSKRQLAVAVLRDELELYKLAGVPSGERSFSAAAQAARFSRAAEPEMRELALPEPVVRLAPEVVKPGVAAQRAERDLA